MPTTKTVRTRLSPAKFIRMYVLDLSQDELAEALGVSQSMVAKMERADQKVPAVHRKKFHALSKKKGRELQDDWFDVVPVSRAAR